MELITKPKITSYRSSKPVSFSELCSMKDCMLKGFLKSRVVVIDYPAHGEATVDLICGYIFHALMRDMPKYFTMTKHSRRKIVRSDVESYIDEYAMKYPSFDFSDYRYWPKLAKAIDTVVNNESFGTNDVIGSELRIVSRDAKTVGIIDLIERTSDGIQIIDYKSSNYSNDIGLPERYVEQLHYYAMLVEDSFGEYPRRGFIEYFHCEKVVVPLDIGFSKKLHERARSIYSIIEAVNRGEKNLKSMSNLSAHNCCDCSVSYLCPVVHSSTFKVDSAFSSSMLAEVVSIQYDRLKLLTKSGITCSNTSVFLLQISPPMAKKFEQGQTYLFTNLVYLKNNKYNLSKNTRIYWG